MTVRHAREACFSGPHLGCWQRCRPCDQGANGAQTVRDLPTQGAQQKDQHWGWSSALQASAGCTGRSSPGSPRAQLQGRRTRPVTGARFDSDHQRPRRPCWAL